MEDPGSGPDGHVETLPEELDDNGDPDVDDFDDAAVAHHWKAAPIEGDDLGEGRLDGRPGSSGQPRLCTAHFIFKLLRTCVLAWVPCGTPLPPLPPRFLIDVVATSVFVLQAETNRVVCHRAD